MRLILFNEGVAMPCSVLQSVAMCCRVLQCVACRYPRFFHCCRVVAMNHNCDASYSMRVLQCVAVSCGVLQCVAVCCSVLQCVACRYVRFFHCCRAIALNPKCDVCYSMQVLQCVAMCCSVLQCVACGYVRFLHRCGTESQM